MKATTDMVLTKDRTRAVPLGDPDGDPLAWVASKGEEIPDTVPTNKEKAARAKPESKASVPEENK